MFVKMSYLSEHLVSGEDLIDSVGEIQSICYIKCVI